MFVLLILLTLGFTPIAAAQPWEICGDASMNYTTNSTYHANLELLSTMLIDNATSSPDHFATGSVGAGPDDTVYGLALCRGDVNATVCRACVATASQGAQRLCPNRTDATVFYPTCRLRFSGMNFLHPDNYSQIVDGVVDTMNTRDTTNTEPLLLGWDPGNAQSVSTITEIVGSLLQETASQAAYNSGARMFATGLMDVGGGGFPALYSMAQCVPALSHRDCSSCLQVIGFMATDNFAGRQGGRLLALWCNLRYDTAHFYSGDPMVTIASPVKDVVPLVVPSHKHRRAVKVVVPLLASFIGLTTLYIFMRQRRKRGSQDKDKMSVKEDAVVWGLEGRSLEFVTYDFSQILEATDNFSEENKLGQGGFGHVYKGRFPDGSEIAVKRLASHSGQGFTQFKNEVQLIAKLQHTNLVRLLGCCSQEEEKILIYEFLPNKSLDFFIFDDTRRALLYWNRRLAIIEGIAQGLLYLHKHSRLRVIHRDLKASNILLDHEMNPKISDFGLAKIFSTNDTELNTERIVGTYGYMAPEYASEGLFSMKSDVFSFGVLTLEIVSGKRSSGLHRYGDFINLLGHIVPVPPRIGEDEPPPSWDPVLTPKAMVGRDSPKLSMIPKGSPKLGRMLGVTSGRMKKVSPQSRLAKKKTASSPKGNQVSQRAVWNGELEKSLVEILFEYKDTGCRGDNGWSSEGWNRMVKEFHVRNKYVSFTKKQVQEKENQLKKDYKMLKEARKQSGASWNEKRCMVEASPALWENLKITFPKITKFRNNKASFPLYDALGEIYDGHLAEGNHNCTSLDSMEDEEPLRLVQELEENELEEADVVLLEDQRNSREKETDVVLLEDQRNSREEENDVVLLEDQRNPREQETKTEEQRRRALIEKKRQEKEDKKAKKASKNSKVESMMEQYLDMRTKQVQDEAAVLAKEKEAATVNDFSITRCISVLSTMEVTKEEKAKAFQVFIKSKENREAFLSGCELDQDATLMWLKSVMV